MKNSVLLSAGNPAAKIQIGNEITATLDTSTYKGKKSFQINIVTPNDTISKEIEGIVDDIKNDIEEEAQSQESSRLDSRNEEREYRTEVRVERQDTVREAIRHSFPIMFLILLFGYLAFRHYQKRKWIEALLNRGLNADQVQNLVNDKGTDTEILKKNDIQGYEVRKNLKYAIMFSSFGIAVLVGTVMDDFGYFAGTLFLLLGIGFWYFNTKTK